MSQHFIDRLADFGPQTALITATGARISYQDLARLADAFAEMLGPNPGLVLIEMHNAPEAVIAYTAALRAGIPVILGGEGSAQAGSDLIRAFRPDHIYRQIGGLWQLDRMPNPGDAPAPLHADLAVMLSTSGSTGSAKLVKLSRENLHENARSIVEYLQIDATRVAITNLPGHYSYGLSVINSFLFAGATIVLSDTSVISDAFWAQGEAAGVTDLAGVPYTYELLERRGFRDSPPPSLRVMTQAGGRLPPDLVRDYADFATARDIRFFVMYGQTEATARMAYLPPGLAAENPDCIGIPIPRGAFSLQGPDGSDITGADTPGELIYRGPNVMMGYALTREDLAQGASLDALHTGDIAQRQANGLYRIIGRSSRFSKIAGLRIGFDDVEALLRAAGFAGYVSGDDARLVIGITRGDAQAAAVHVSLACKLPQQAVFAWALADVPTLGSGKIDYPAIRSRGLALAGAEAQAARANPAAHSIAGIYARALNCPTPGPDRSFADLGGDSLAYVTVSVGLEEMLGHLPPQWEMMPIAALQTLCDAQPVALADVASRPLTLGSDVMLRLAAISLVFLGHGAPDQTEFLRGGSSILFCLAGYSMARHQFASLAAGRPFDILKGIAVRLVLPYFILMTALLAVTDAKPSLSWYLLASVFELTATERGPLFSFWFIETLIHATLLTCALFLFAPFRKLMAQAPFATSVALIGLAAGFCWLGERFWPNPDTLNLTLDGWLYAFFIGWAVHFARNRREQALVLALTVSIAFAHFGVFTGRAYWLVLAVAILLALPTIRVNRRLGHILAYMSGATYFMYLAHALVVHAVRHALHIANPGLSMMLVYGGSVLLGLAGAELWRLIMRRGQDLLRRS